MIYIASDHGGFDIKCELVTFLSSNGYKYTDLGTDSSDSVDYPEYAHRLCKKVLEKDESHGILICGTGIGMSMVANRHQGIRAALCTSEYEAKMSKEHNNANVLCLGGRVVGCDLAKSIVKTWLESKFSEEKRHVRRVEKIEV